MNTPICWAEPPGRRALARLVAACVVFVVGAGLALALGLLLGGEPAAALSPRQTATPAALDAGPCDSVTSIPAAECQALVALYFAAGGSDWTTRTNWGTFGGGGPCGWFGVTCGGGRVTAIHLAGNNLSGILPAALSELDALHTLHVNDNRLSGAAPMGVCALADRGVTVDVRYNRVYPSAAQTAQCLTQLQPGWQATQTNPPSHLHASAIATSSVTLAWEPVSHPNGGRYVISRALTMAGPWTPVTATTDLTADSFTVEGLESGRPYWFRVQTVTEAGGGQTSVRASEPALMPAVTRSPETVLVTVFFAADNDLSAYAPQVLDRLRRGTTVNPSARVVYLVDEAGTNNSTLYLIANGVITPTTAVVQHFGAPEVDSADPETLAWFLSHARSTVPGAAREIVSLLGHGVGLVPEYTLESQDLLAATSLPVASPQLIVPLPREKDATPTDLTSGSFLSTHDLADALAVATANGANPFDLLFLDQCFGGSLDLLYELRTSAEQFVASPNYAWMAAPYDRYMVAFAPLLSAEEIARAVIAIYQSKLDDSHPNAIVSVKRSEIELLLTQLSTLGNALSAGLASAPHAAALQQTVAAATQGSRYVDTALCGDQGLSLHPPDEQIGAMRFAHVLSTTVPSGDQFGIQSAASSLANTVSGLERTYRTGVPYIAPGELWLYDDVLTILAPLPRTTDAPAAWRSTIYRTGAPFSATYAPAPELRLTIERSFASAADGTWDEFLDIWYTAERGPTIGQWCRYTPASLVISDTAQIVELELVTSTTGTSTFAWQNLAGVEVWQLFLQMPDSAAMSRGWVLIATVPAVLQGQGASGQQSLSYSIDQLPPGLYGARIAGLNEDDVVTAWSEPQPLESAWRQLLPMVRN